MKNLSENQENKPPEVTDPTPEPQTPPQTATTLKPSEEPKKPLPIFNFKLKAKVLEAILSAIAIIIDEATFTITLNGVNLKALDPGRVVMVVFNYPKEAFEEFSVSREGPITFNIKEALKILRRTGKDDTAELVMVSDSARLFLKVHSKHAERLFDIPTLESSEEELPEPKLSLEAKIKLTTQVLNSAVEDAAIVSDHVKILTVPEIFELKATGDMTTADIKLVKGISPDLLDLEKQDLTKPTSATFSLEWLKAMSKTIKDISDVVVVSYSTDMPIQIDVQNTKGSMTFYQAPRIEVED